jgi:hypothetical protein
MKNNLHLGRSFSLANTSIGYSPPPAVKWEPPKILNNEKPTANRQFETEKFGNRNELEGARRRSKREFRMTNLMPENLTYGDANVIYSDDHSNELRDHLQEHFAAKHPGQFSANRYGNPNPVKQQTPTPNPLSRPPNPPNQRPQNTQNRPSQHAPSSSDQPVEHANVNSFVNTNDAVQFLDVDPYVLAPNIQPLEPLEFTSQSYDPERIRLDLEFRQNNRENITKYKATKRRIEKLDEQLIEYRQVERSANAALRREQEKMAEEHRRQQKHGVDRGRTRAKYAPRESLGKRGRTGNEPAEVFNFAAAAAGADASGFV